MQQKQPTKIGIDMDGVLFNFAARYAELYTKRHPDDPKTEQDIIQDWNVAKTTKCGDKLWKCKGFFLGEDPYPGAMEFFNWLYFNYDVVVVSTAPPLYARRKDHATQKAVPRVQRLGRRLLQPQRPRQRRLPYRRRPA